MNSVGIDDTFVQDNHSLSALKGTVRGLHYQRDPFAQTKLVRCTKGRIFDVAVDIRRGSPQYGKWTGVELSASNKMMLYIPRGFAHGFSTLEDDTEVQYKVDNLYNKESEGSIRFDDPFFAIDWKVDRPLLSEKDSKAPSFDKCVNDFKYRP